LITPARRLAKALKSEGYEVVLANSNPATIMTDPEIADRTYIEPLTLEYWKQLSASSGNSRGRGFCGVATVGGQTRAEPGDRTFRRRRPGEI